MSHFTRQETLGLLFILNIETGQLYSVKTNADIVTKNLYIYKVLSVDGQKIKAHNFNILSCEDEGGWCRG